MGVTRSRNEGSGLDERLGAGMGLGLVAGGVFIAFEVVVAAIFGPGPLGPVRMISAIFLGPGAMEPVATVAPLVGIGLLVHFLLSAVYGGVFLAVAGGLEDRGRGALVGSGVAFGLALWVVNFYLLSPSLFPWFEMANPVVQFFAHALFFGGALGFLVAVKHRTASPARRVR